MKVSWQYQCTTTDTSEGQQIRKHIKMNWCVMIICERKNNVQEKKKYKYGPTHTHTALKNTGRRLPNKYRVVRGRTKAFSMKKKNLGDAPQYNKSLHDSAWPAAFVRMAVLWFGITQSVLTSVQFRTWNVKLEGLKMRLVFWNLLKTGVSHQSSWCKALILILREQKKKTPHEMIVK